MVRQADSNHQDAGAPVTLERIYPDAIPADDLAQKLSLELHLQRYRFASQHLVGVFRGEIVMKMVHSEHKIDYVVSFLCRK